MPYITNTRALQLQTDTPKVKGELNYLITNLMIEFVEEHGTKYQVISDAIAAAQDAADEMKRRLLAPYETLKSKERENIDPYDVLKSNGNGNPKKI